jgi:hypothetical protein
MKNDLSISKLCLLTFLIGFISTSCESLQFDRNQDSGLAQSENPLKQTEPAEVPSKYRLQEDREKFAELRSEIPQQKKEENDEKALMLELTAELKQPPDRIRDKFDKLKRKKRDYFERDMKSLRKEFTENERKQREITNADLKRERESFKFKKASSEQRKQFFSDLEAKRKLQQSDLKQKRDDFEADVREKRKDFEDYMRVKQNEFNQELQIYRTKWQQREREKRMQN